MLVILVSDAKIDTRLMQRLIIVSAWFVMEKNE